MSEKQATQMRTSRIILILMGIALLISLYLIVTATITYFQGGEGWQPSLIVGILILGGLWGFNYFLRRRGIEEVEFHTVSQMKCEQEGCAYTEIRDYKEGDYVYKRLGKCPSCGGQDTLYIDLIYAYNPRETEPERAPSPKVPQVPQGPQPP